VIGRTVTVYSIMQDPSGAARDLVDGEKLALSEANGRAGRARVNFSSLDAGDGPSPTRRGRAARDQRPADHRGDRRRDAGDRAAVHPRGILQVAPGGDLALATDDRSEPRPGAHARPPQDEHVPADFDARFKAAFNRDPQPLRREGYRAMRRHHPRGRRRQPGNDRTVIASSAPAAFVTLGHL
jgi:hypothetical protein